MRILALLLALAISTLAQEPGVTWEKPPKHAYVMTGYVPYLLATKDSRLCVIFAKDKAGNKIMVGIDMRYIKAIESTFLKPEINYKINNP